MAPTKNVFSSVTKNGLSSMIWFLEHHSHIFGRSNEVSRDHAEKAPGGALIRPKRDKQTLNKQDVL